jgi:hypothetical protein
MFIAVPIVLATVIRQDDGPGATDVIMKSKNVKHKFDVTIHTQVPFGFPFTISSIVTNSSSNNTSTHIKITYRTV